MTFWGRLKMLKIFFHLTMNPKRTDLIFEAIGILSTSPDQSRIEAIEKKILAHDDFRKLYEANYVPQIPTVASLAASAEGTFGQAVYQHMSQNGLDFEIWPQVKIKRPINYLTARGYLDHDLWHALLGYGIGVEDELAIQGFNVAQFGSPLSVMLILGGLLKMLAKNPIKAVEAFQMVNEGYTRGLNSRFLLGLRLHDYFDTPLADVRALAQITARA